MMRALLILLPCLFSLSALADERGVVIVPTELYSAADRESSIAGSLEADTELTILQQKGTWYEVMLDDSSRGWVWLNVQPLSNSSWLEWFRRVMKGADSSEENTVATIGIRGLGPGDIKQASPDPAELEKLDRYQSTPARAARSARAANLDTREVSYLMISEPDEAPAPSRKSPRL